MYISIILPVRFADKETEKFADYVVAYLEDIGHIVYYPPRDTKQEDETGGYIICVQNLSGIDKADVVIIFYDGESKGVLFDAGMAFALQKKVVVLMRPELTLDKSFQNMMEYWQSASYYKPFVKSVRKELALDNLHVRVV